MTCRQLGGACDLEFRAASFEEMAELSKQHGMEMAEKRDAASGIRGIARRRVAVAYP